MERPPLPRAPSWPLLLLLLCSACQHDGGAAASGLHRSAGRQSQLAVARAPATTGRQLQACVPKKMLWFTAIAGIGAHLHEYKRNIRAAVMSARKHAPSLLPHLLINTEDVQADKFIKWYQHVGGTVHPWNLTFKQKLVDAVHKHHWHDENWLTQYGAYMRIDIPLVIQKDLAGKLDASKVELSYVLYTDADVMFEADINSCTAPPVPRTLLVAGDYFSPNAIANTGVTFINVSALAEHHSRMIEFGERTHWNGIYDQTLILDYFGPMLTLLHSKYNWTPSWGLSREAVVLHFHGPKPERCLTCLVISLQANGRRRDFPYKHCNCPDIYMNIFLSAIDKDKGEAYILSVVKFYDYVLSSLQLRD